MLPAYSPRLFSSSLPFSSASPPTPSPTPSTPRASPDAFNRANHQQQRIRNGLASLPFMGWSTWGQFQCNINEDLILAMAQAIKQHSSTPRATLWWRLMTAGKPLLA